MRHRFPSPHPRHPAHRCRCAGQGRQREARSRNAHVHHRDVPARAPRHAGRRRAHLRTAHRPRRSTGRRLAGRRSEEPPEEERLKTVEAQVSQSTDLGFSVAGVGFELAAIPLCARKTAGSGPVPTPATHPCPTGRVVISRSISELPGPRWTYRCSSLSYIPLPLRRPPPATEPGPAAGRVWTSRGELRGNVDLRTNSTPFFVQAWFSSV